MAAIPLELPATDARGRHLVGVRCTIHPDNLWQYKQITDRASELLAKNAEDRYQSARSLQADLRHCLAQLQATGQLEPFELGRDDFTRIPGGAAGVQHRLALLHTLAVATGQLSPTSWVRLVAQRPAEIFGLYPRKGTIAPGSDADVVIFDPDKEEDIVDLDILLNPLKTRITEKKVGRNEPCPCGSGKKYKQCHGKL